MSIRQAQQCDFELLLAWLRLLPLNASRDSTRPTLREHTAWCLANPDQYIIWYNDRKVGVVGYTLPWGRPWVSIHIVEPELRGKGIATESIQLLIDGALKGHEECLAEVHVGNQPSKKLFESLGFVQNGRMGDWTLWARKLP